MKKLLLISLSLLALNNIQANGDDGASPLRIGIEVSLLTTLGIGIRHAFKHPESGWKPAVIAVSAGAVPYFGYRAIETLPSPWALMCKYPGTTAGIIGGSIIAGPTYLVAKYLN